MWGRDEGWPGRSGQRSRLGRVALDVAATVGFEAMTMQHIADTAGVVRRTVNRYFRSKEEAFTYGYREAIGELRGGIQGAYDASSSPYDRVHSCLAAIARFLAEDPARAYALIVVGHSAGPATLAVHEESMRRMVRLIQENAEDLVPPGSDGRMLAEASAGGIYWVILTRTLNGQIHELPELVPEWARALIAPYAAIAGLTEDAAGAAASSPCLNEW